MRKLLLIPLLFMPLIAGAAAYPEATSSAPENTYTAASQVTIAKPLPADLITAGASVTVNAPIDGDVLAAGGTVTVAKGAGGDVRVAGARVDVSGPVGGDIAAAGGAVRIRSAAQNIYAAAASVDVAGSSSGDVTLYGANVMLSGDYAGNVSIVASNNLTIADNTHIHGVLKYSAPEKLVASEGTVIDGGAKYTGAYAYVPTSEQAHQYALVGTGIFFAVRILAGMIVAGLIAGLFPLIAEDIASMALTRNPYATVKHFGIGLALAVLTPVLCLMLLISFVGAGLAFLLIVLYALLVLLAYAFCGITLGVLLRRTLLYRIRGVRDFTWKDAALGTVCLHVVGLVPYLGTFGMLALMLVCAGTVALFAYDKSFGTNYA